MEDYPSWVIYLLPLYSILMITLYIFDKGDPFNTKPYNMETLTKFLTFLQGKKATIGAIIALIITYSLTKGYIDNDMAILFNGILVVLGIGANVGTSKLVK